MLNLNHKRLDVWEMGVSFVGIIYELTKDFPKSESYGITNQLKGSVLAFKHLQSSVIWLHSYICKEI
ncbi:MAG: four helix bundle protein, partial [bacterium]|nr:four helix bundle protein [bacterium]